MVIVVVGVALGLAFNALGLASKPPRGLSWITEAEKMPSLEELQPGSGAGPGARAASRARGPRSRWWGPPGPVGVTSPRRRARVRDKPPAAVKKPVSEAGRPRRRSAAAGDERPSTVKSAEACARRPPPRPSARRRQRSDLPVVPDLDQPIEVKLANVKRFFDAGAALFVDAREAPEYAEGHIAGALSVPFDDAVSEAGAARALQDGRASRSSSTAAAATASCRRTWPRTCWPRASARCWSSPTACQAWKAAGYPVERGAAKGGPMTAC